MIAHARLALGDARGALDGLAAVREDVASAGWTQRLVEILVLEAQAHEALGERSQALTPLKTALDLSRSEGFVRPFAQAGPPLPPLPLELIAAAPAAEQRAFIEAILAALDAPVTPVKAIGLNPGPNETWLQVGRTFALIITEVTAIFI